MFQPDQDMSDQRVGELIHLLNNLLAVIQTQVDVARAGAVEGSAENALNMIERCSDKAARQLAEIRSRA